MLWVLLLSSDYYIHILDKQQETLFYQIEADDPNEHLQSIAELFTLIESNKDSLNLETYSLSQTTLEQVFLTFARDQRAIDQKYKYN